MSEFHAFYLMHNCNSAAATVCYISSLVAVELIPILPFTPFLA